jgi:hypothetical protein
LASEHLFVYGAGMADHTITDDELVILRQSAAMAPLSTREMDRVLDALEAARRQLRELERAEAGKGKAKD